MALGIVEQCLDLSVADTTERLRVGRPIGELQLIEQTLAAIEVARTNIRSLVRRTIETSNAGAARRSPRPRRSSSPQLGRRPRVPRRPPGPTAATAPHGGNRQMAEHHVGHLAGDLEALRIDAGTDGIRTCAVARALLADA